MAKNSTELNAPIRIAITGAAGRMGKTLIQAIQNAEDMVLGAAIEHPQSPAVGADAGEIAGVGALGIIITAEPLEVVNDFDVAIDFTVPAATISLAKACAVKGLS